MTDLSTPAQEHAQQAARSSVGPPLWLLAELTYRCPLHCAFCYNPVDYTRHRDELSTAQWIDVLQQARKLGAAQLGFSGGEPLMRDDLEELVAELEQTFNAKGLAPEVEAFVDHARSRGWLE